MSGVGSDIYPIRDDEKNLTVKEIRVTRCSEVINAALEKYGCRMDISVLVSSRGSIPNLKIVPVEDFKVTAVSELFIAETSDTVVPLALSIAQEGVGGVTGESPTVALRDVSTTTSYLDFGDNTFKVAGWTTKYASMTEIERGHYQRILDASAVPAIVAGTILAAEYRVDDGGSIIGDDHDLILFVTSIDDIPGDVGGTSGLVVVEGELFRFNDFVTEITLPSSGSQAARLITLDASTTGFGRVYIESNLSIVFVKFGDSLVSATTSPTDSIRLVGGAPWTLGTGGTAYMSVAASSDISLRVRGLLPV